MLLILNAGSSSIKFALYDLPLSERGKPRLEGQIAGIGNEARFTVAGERLPQAGPIPDHEAAIAQLLDWLEAEGHARAGRPIPSRCPGQAGAPAREVQGLRLTP